MDFKVPILTYHSIDNSGSVISTDSDKFRSQMKILRDRKFHVISLNELVSSIRQNQPLPPKAAVITFDDGFKNFYHSAYPTLKEFGFKPTVFLVPGYIGKLSKWNGELKGIPVLDLLHWDEVKEMSDNGIDFGAHTMSHPDLCKLSLAQARDEIIESKSLIQRHIGRSVRFFSYPYGTLGQEIQAIVQDEFYGACSTDLDFVAPGSDVYALPRIDMYYIAITSLFKWPQSPLFSYYIKICNILRLLKTKTIPKSPCLF